MIKEIITDESLLNTPANNKTINPDVVQDLLDTANYNIKNCAGLASNQIGSNTFCFVVKINGKFTEFINPKILARGNGVVSAFESCLSRPNSAPIKKRRYKMIKISYTTLDGKEHKHKYTGFIARVIQHEMDHLKGKLI